MVVATLLAFVAAAAAQTPKLQPVAALDSRVDKVAAAEDALDAMDQNLAQREKKTLTMFNEVTVKQVKAKLNEAKQERAELAAHVKAKKNAMEASMAVLARIKKAEAAAQENLQKDEDELKERMEAHNEERAHTNKYAQQQKDSVNKLRGIVSGLKDAV